MVQSVYGELDCYRNRFKEVPRASFSFLSGSNTPKTSRIHRLKYSDHSYALTRRNAQSSKEPGEVISAEQQRIFK